MVIGEPQSPPSGWVWIIIGGIINHINGQSSALNIADKPNSRNLQLVGFVDSVDATGAYPFPNIPVVASVAATNAFLTEEDHPASYLPPRIDNEEILAITGAAGATAIVRVYVLPETARTTFITTERIVKP